MANIIWTSEKEEILRKWYPIMDTHSLHLKLGPGFSYQQCKQKAKRMGLKKEVGNSIPYNSPWRRINKELFIELFPNTSTLELVDKFHVSKSAINQMAHKLGLKKSPEYLVRYREKTHFKKGHSPANKGVKGIRVSPHSEFKKGNLPKNTLYNGAVSIRKDNRGVPYKHIRISQAVWKHLHVQIWEEKNGPTPEGHCIVFKDGDTMNCNIENLECISKHENMLRNSASINLPDSFVAHLLAGKRYKHIKKEILDRPELIELKRQSLILNRLKNEYS
jgi:hypothetical protein